MITKTLTVTNRLGLHARAAGELVRLSSTFKSEIAVIKEGIRVNAKSIMGLLLLEAARGSVVDITTEGVDEKEAAVAVMALFKGNFHEE